MSAEMPGDDTEIRDEPREAEEGMTDDELDAYNATGEVREPFFDPRDPDPIEFSEGDTEPPREEYFEVREPYFDPARGIDEAQGLDGE